MFIIKIRNFKRVIIDFNLYFTNSINYNNKIVTLD